VVETLTKEEIDALLVACDRSKTWKNRQVTANERPTADRDRAIILLLLDTGLRASELCGVKFGDINLTANSIKVLGKGHASREQLVYFGKRTSKALWKLLTPRLKDAKSEDLVFTVGLDDDLRPMTRDVLRRLLVRVGERAGVANVYPHRFRHTFAITYLSHREAPHRNQGDLEPKAPFRVHPTRPARPLGHGDGEALCAHRADRSRSIPVGLRQGASEGVAGG
jgi:integrase/recombinase XerD